MSVLPWGPLLCFVVILPSYCLLLLVFYDEMNETAIVERCALLFSSLFFFFLKSSFYPYDEIKILAVR